MEVGKNIKNAVAREIFDCYELVSCLALIATILTKSPSYTPYLEEGLRDCIGKTKIG